ncbi:WavE lipopolysaccharide synthesis family protein [Polynucleobacter sp. Adler-ghost]|uniref:WavE lipopolysaccharide synthesis family protein n=1 Tax=Polynucleobacter sp. Adler-ghost TaxID=2770234 RepID=UPI001BFD67A8|nr:WavE lipopolysaccharide synthesis family protein [Polynucleobacter sp. Adler-ghost]
MEAKGYLKEKYKKIKPSHVDYQSNLNKEFYEALVNQFEYVILSTWEGEHPLPGIDVIYNIKPKPLVEAEIGKLENNSNLQAISTLAGIKKIQEKFGDSSVVVKIRADISFKPQVLKEALTRIGDNKIYPSYFMGLASIDDFIIAGNTKQMKIFFEEALRSYPGYSKISHSFYVLNYLRSIYGNVKYLHESVEEFYPLMVDFYKKFRYKFRYIFILPIFKKYINILQIFEFNFEPLFSKSEYIELDLSWRGSKFSSESLNAEHLSKQIFSLEEKIYSKKISKSLFNAYLMFRMRAIYRKLKFLLGRFFYE